MSGLLVTNCATVTRGTTNQIQINSEPSGAVAQSSLGHACTTPCTIQVARSSEFTVVYRLDGHHDASVPVKVQIAGAGVAGFAGNVIVGGIVGMGVDAATGATLEHVPNPVFARLQPLAPARAVSPRGRTGGRTPAAKLVKPLPEPMPPPPVTAPPAATERGAVALPDS